MTEESPRFKQLFAYLTQSSSEEELDRITAEMTMDGYVEQVRCPTLLIAGEFDPRSPIDEIYRFFDKLTAPAELWVFADQHHNPSYGDAGSAVWQADLHMLACDWLRDRFAGKPLSHPGQVLYVEPSSAGPNSPSVALKRRWYE